MAEAKSPDPTPKINPPYLAYRTLRNFLDGLRTSGIPGRIDRSVMTSLSGGAQSALIGTLRFFDLISPDGAPTNALERLVKAESDERNKILGDLLRKHYAFVFPPAFNLEKATMKMVREAFDKAVGGGDTARKSMVFFLVAAKEAGVPVSNFIKVREVARPFGIGRRRVNGKQDASGAGGVIDPMLGNRESGAKEKSASEMLFDLLDPEAMEDDEQQAVWTLLKYIKRTES